MRVLLFSLVLFLSNTIFSQSNLQQLLEKHNEKTIPYIYAKDLKSISEDVIILDARELKEFKVSHLKEAIYTGYDNFNLKKTLKKLPKNKKSKIVVYCSLGVRSEDIAEQIKKSGYSNTFNLYGGIFEWKNNGNKVYNSQNKTTNKVHVFNKEWSVWLKKGIKVYE